MKIKMSLVPKFGGVTTYISAFAMMTTIYYSVSTLNDNILIKKTYLNKCSYSTQSLLIQKHIKSGFLK